MSAASFSIVRVKTPAQKALCHAIRFEVFVAEQNVPPERELDEWENVSTHYMVVANGEEVATARLRFDGNVAHIERVAVRARWRGQGVGHALVRHLMAEARRRGRVCLEVGSQIQALPFYEKLGFRSYGDQYDDAGIPHRHMRAA